jgi:hypothetical protein
MLDEAGSHGSDAFGEVVAKLNIPSVTRGRFAGGFGGWVWAVGGGVVG